MNSQMLEMSPWLQDVGLHHNVYEKLFFISSSFNKTHQDCGTQDFWIKVRIL